MKNLRKLLAVIITVALLVTVMVPAFAEEPMTDAEICELLGVLKGEGDGVTADYLAKQPTRMQAAIMFLRLQGLEDEALAYEGEDNFADADQVWAGGQAILAYLKANPDLGFIGVGDNKFDPLGPITAQAYYKVLLTALGYEYGVDFTWSQVFEFAAGVGLTAVADADPFTVNDLAIATVEALNANVAGEETTLVAQMIAAGIIAEEDAITAGLVAGEIAIDEAKMTGMKIVSVAFNQPVDTTKAVIKIKKGAAIYYSTTAWNEAKDTATLTTVMALPAGDYTVEVTGLTDTALTKTITATAETPSKLEITTTSIPLTNGTTIGFKVSNQYGEAISTIVGNNLSFVGAYDTTQKTALTITKDGTTNLALPDPFATTAKAGDVIRVTVSYLSMTVQANVTVIDPSSAATISLGQVSPLAGTTRITVGETGLKIPYTMFDQYGAAATLPAHAAADAAADIETIGTGSAAVQFVSSNAAVVDVDSFRVDASGNLTFTAGAAGTAIITGIMNTTGVVTQTSITVNAAGGAVASMAISSPTALIAATEVVTLNVTAADQYGTAIAANSIAGVTFGSSNTAVVANAAISLAAGKLTITTAGAGTTVISAYVGTTVVGSVTLVVEAQAVATQVTSVSFAPKFEVGATKTFGAGDFVVLDQYGRAISATFAVAKKDGTATTFALNTTTKVFTANAAGSEVFTLTATAGGASAPAVEFTVTAIASTDIATYAITPVATIYGGGDAAHAKALELTGKTAAGETVVLAAGKIAYATSSDPTKATVAVAGGVATVTGTAGGSGTVVISVYSASAKLADTTITVSNAAPVVTTVSFSGAETTLAATVELYDNLSVLDQYGVAIDAAVKHAGFWTTSNAAKATVSNTDATDGQVTDVAAVAGDSITIGYVSINGIMATTVLTK